MQPIEDFIISLIEKAVQSGDPKETDHLLRVIPSYIQDHIARFTQNASKERERVAQAIANQAPDCLLTEKVLDLIRAENA
jgi:hypothetical protein